MGSGHSKFPLDFDSALEQGSREPHATQGAWEVRLFHHAMINISFSLFLLPHNGSENSKFLSCICHAAGMSPKVR